MNQSVTRRRFLAAAPAAGLVAPVAFAAPGDKPALLGGSKVRTTQFPSWPVIDRTEEKALMDVLQSRRWYRGSGKVVDRFEGQYANLTGAKQCLATANGTSALLISLAALGIGAGDEVILPPYTFVATVNVVLALNALPVFVDSDVETFQIDPRKIEAAITDRTAAIMPVHLGGAAADVDAIMAIAAKRKIPVVEDTCQSHLAEWRGRKLGTYGAAGCFSFQASKNLNSGEGGAILTNDADFVEKCYAYHNNSRGRRSDGYDFSYIARGLNLRMTEFQAALLLAQMTRLEQQAKTREQNAAYLTAMLREIPGTVPARMYEGCTRNAYHLYMFRYQPEKFAGLSRAKFLKALNAEGIPSSGGYAPLNKEPFLKNTLQSKGFQRLFSKDRLARWEKQSQCPANDRLCGEAVWFTQNMLLGPRSDMDQIVAAVKKIQAHASELAKA
ncbi:MAG TPA: DegT/DnrJ/EryC1/StrS family aminotransferase [Bryobacteraceae bacterium]|nr:DegT/DnrJ/EryC1/StrS family aminotransferase [Bryobacteraceae bacterium]